MSDMQQIDPRELVKKLRDYDTCTDEDVDQAAKVIETLVAEVKAARSDYELEGYENTATLKAREATNTLLKLES